MKNLFCEECDKEIPFVYVDGYDFGDRMMEGVMFKVTVLNGKPKCIGVKDSQQSYMQQFNWDYWCAKCEDFCDDLDIATCPECNDDVIVEDEETAANRPAPVVVGKVETFGDIVNKLRDMDGKDISKESYSSKNR